MTAYTWPPESLENAARRARELVLHRSKGTGVISSVSTGNTPAHGHPVALPEYLVGWGDQDDPEMRPGDILMLAMPLSQVFRSVLPDGELTVSVSDVVGFGDGYLAAGRPRASLFGRISVLPKDRLDVYEEVYCAKHPDARAWMPRVGPHTAFFVRFSVHSLYFVGGFGDKNYIGFIDGQQYYAAHPRSRSDVDKNWPVPDDPNL